jgi:hypothetical protein
MTIRTVLSLAAASLVLAGCQVGRQTVAPSETTSTIESTTSTSPSSALMTTTSTSPPPGPTSRTRPPASVPGALADPPPSLTQLCTAGYTKTIRPPVGYTDALKRQQLAEFGYADRNPADFEEDHLIPLGLSGAPKDERNLWPQPWPEARVKDREEDALHVAVCEHRMSLADAEQKILGDWGPR